jgi:roadblock/LC7 domain-containing protein
MASTTNIPSTDDLLTIRGIIAAGQFTAEGEGEVVNYKANST